MGAKRALKRLARPVLRPVARPVVARLDQRLRVPFESPALAGLEGRIEALEQALRDERSRLSTERNRLLGLTNQLQADVNYHDDAIHSLEKHLPPVLNLIASRNASIRHQEQRLDDQDRRLDDQEQRVGSIEQSLDGTSEGMARLERRLETIRKEALFEIRYGMGDLVKRSTVSVEPKILDPIRKAEMGRDVRINLGAGHVVLPDYLNVDIRDLPGIDVVAAAENLPFEPAELAEIYSAHLLEHFPAEQLRRQLLPYWVSLLRPGGRFTAIVPDIEAMTAEAATGAMPWSDFIEVVYGGQEYEGDFHFAGFSREALLALVATAGLSNGHYIETARRNGMCLEMELVATRGLEREVRE